MLRLVGKQISDLVANPLEGIRVIVNEEDITVVNAIIDGPGTLVMPSFVTVFCRHLLSMWMIG